jgi:2-polyprenyl-3-methyl-5-hydroxy-6-metoxy-1,4-benzoquinol methylase
MDGTHCVSTRVSRIHVRINVPRLVPLWARPAIYLVGARVVPRTGTVKSEGWRLDITYRNKEYFDALYAKSDVRSLVNGIRILDHFLINAIATDISWHAIGLGGLWKKLSGLKVLELGAGDGLNALTMAALGADVVAIDISAWTSVLLREAASQLNLLGRISVHTGDFLAMSEFPPCTFDLIVGRWFLHHLDHAAEANFLQKTASVLKLTGEARFFEPATNSPALDRLGYLMPAPGRPSSLNRSAFRAWQEADRHPVRDNRSEHFREAAGKEFGAVEIVCMGCLERFHRLLPKGRLSRAYRRSALGLEKLLPARCNEVFARFQLIICREPNTQVRS